MHVPAPYFPIGFPFPTGECCQIVGLKTWPAAPACPYFFAAGRQAPAQTIELATLLSLERDDWKDEARRKARQRLISCFQADFYLQVYLTPLCSPSKERSCGDCQVRIT